MRQVSLAVLIGLGAIALVAYLTLFTVPQTQLALVLQFGDPVRVVDQPGLNWKVPFIQNVTFFDKRILDIDTAPQEVIASDRKRLVVDAFARYRIVNPLLFFQSVGDEEGAQLRIAPTLEAALRRVLGSSSFAAVVSERREALMKLITQQLNQESKAFGVEVVDVRIKRADLPEANSQAIYRRMQTERAREASEIRAQGESASRRIRATGDRQAVVIRADATGESDRIRGDGDATRNRIYADAYGRDPEFFAFYRSMQAYEAGLTSDQTKLVISPTGEFFRYFNNPSAAAAAQTPAAETRAAETPGGQNGAATPAPPASPSVPAPDARAAPSPDEKAAQSAPNSPAVDSGAGGSTAAGEAEPVLR